MTGRFDAHPSNQLLARFVGVTQSRGELGRCYLVFHLETDAGDRLDLTHGDVMAALRCAEEQGVMDPLPADWWARDGGRDG